MMNKYFVKFLALSMVVFLAVPATGLTVYADEEEAAVEEPSYNLRIKDVSTLITFAENCKKGGYSQGLSVSLDADIDLTGEDNFDGIDSFSGYFNGNNHTVSGFNITSRSGSIGFFGFIEDGGKVENLNVDGVIYSTDKHNYVGLIAGVNAGEVTNCNAKGIVTGTGTAGGVVGLNGGAATIRNCQNNSSVYSLTGVGGIAGENRGTILGSKNAGEINADSSWLSLEDSSVTTLSIDSIIESFSESVEIGSDIGGIAGLNLGDISSCRNTGVVGYQHAGKNVGGIAGRFCGNINDCINEGKVYGKQDVGGIAGQFEPRIVEDEEDLFQYIYELEDLNQKLVDDTANASIAGEDSLNTAADRIEDAGNDASEDINETTDRVTKKITDQTNDAQFRINKATSSIKELQNELKSVDRQQIRDDARGRINNISVPSYEKVLDSISSVSNSVDSAKDDVADYEVGSLTGEINGYINDNATSTYNDVKDIGERLDENITDTTDQTSTDLRNLSDKIAKQRATLNSDINAINNKISDITSLAEEEVDNLKRIADGGDIIEDYSAVDADNPDGSRIKNCNNLGYINGDRNVGGIAGAIAIEGTDVNDAKSTSKVSKEYVTIAVLENSSSTGIIELRKENAGGIVGNSNVGLIRNCVSKNRVISEEGNYVGGVAGYAKGTVTDCAAISVLEGSNYVGGIAGAAMKLRNCYSMVDIKDDSKWAGEVIGDVVYDTEEDVTISYSNMMNYIFNNYYVGEEFGGINDVSYNGIAEAISYDALKAAGISDDFANLKIYFYDSDYKLVSSKDVQYGQSVSEIKFPTLDTEDDTYLVWDGLFNDSVLGNMFLVAGDADDVTVMASDLKKGDKSVALVQGIYYESSTVDVVERKDIAPPEKTTADSVMKIYELKLENTAVDETMESQVRLYIGDSEHAKLYRLSDDKWIPIKEAKIAGSYVEGSFKGDSAIFAVETFDGIAISDMALLIIAVVVVIVIVLILAKGKKKNKMNKKNS